MLNSALLKEDGYYREGKLLENPSSKEAIAVYGDLVRIMLIEMIEYFNTQHTNKTIFLLPPDAAILQIANDLPRNVRPMPEEG